MKEVEDLMKVYHRKSHHKRGIKLFEVEDNNISKAIEKIKRETNIMDKTIITRWWQIEDEVYMDYGSHTAYLIFKGGN